MPSSSPSISKKTAVTRTESRRYFPRYQKILGTISTNLTRASVPYYNQALGPNSSSNHCHLNHGRYQVLALPECQPPTPVRGKAVQLAVPGSAACASTTTRLASFETAKIQTRRIVRVSNDSENLRRVGEAGRRRRRWKEIMRDVMSVGPWKERRGTMLMERGLGGGGRRVQWE